MKNIKRIFASVIIFVLFSQSVFAAAFDVNDFNNTDDVTPGDGVCQNALGVCTLKAAITEANALVGDHSISNSVLGEVSVDTALPQITRNNLVLNLTGLTINGGDLVDYGLDINSDTVSVTGLAVTGFLQAGVIVRAGADTVSLDGLDLNNNLIGIEIQGSNTLVQNSVIHSNDWHGIKINGANGSSILDNMIGTDATGMIDQGHGADGITIQGNATGTHTISGNVISGNGSDGVSFTTGTNTGTYNFKNNKIGVGADGSTTIANGSRGILADMNSNNAATYVIGTDGDGADDATEGNTIAGNGQGGIVIYDGTAVTVAGNKIGVSSDGSTAIANGSDGVFVDQPDTIVIGTNNDGTSDSLEKNIIAASTGYGIHVTGGSSEETGATVSIAGNAIGGKSDGSGGAGFGNQDGGIEINHSDLTDVNIGLVGVSAVADGRNIIVNNCGGIRVRGVEDAGVDAVVDIINNYIGVQSDGQTAASNNCIGGFDDGVLVDMDMGDVSTVTIGTDATTPSADEANIIVGSRGDGIEIGDGVQNAKIAGNKIGLRSDGVNYVADGGNGTNQSGIEINTTGAVLASVIIGGANALERNFMGWDNEAINIVDAGTVPGAITINNNYIGLGSDGTTGAGNDTGAIVQVADGGALTITNNVVANANTSAVQITGGTGLTFTGNKIGTVATGLVAATNGGYGLHLNAGTLASATIGGNTTAAANVIAGSAGITSHGIYIQNLAANDTAVTIKGNYIGVCAAPSTPSIDSADLANCGNTGAGIAALEGALTIGGDNSFGADGTGALTDANVIANNGGAGISITSNVTSASILGNIIGLIRADAGAFDTAAGNGDGGTDNGITVNSATISTLTIGGVGDVTASSKRNVISGNTNIGILVQALANGTTASILNNYVGTDWAGDTDLGNTSDGVKVMSESANIGGSGANQGNLISGNGGHGVNFTSGAETLAVYGNTIGLAVDKTTDLGNDSSGVYMDQGTSTVNIGSADSGARNYIGGNGASGIAIAGTGALTLSILNNYIGVATDGTTVVENTTRSVSVNNSAVAALTIGSSTAQNKIANDDAIGIRFDDTTATNESTLSTDNTWSTSTGSFGESATPYYFWARYVSSVLTAYAPHQCADGTDNDSDGLVDLLDSGCSDASDNDEYNAPAPTPAPSDTGSVASIVSVPVVNPIINNEVVEENIEEESVGEGEVTEDVQETSGTDGENIIEDIVVSLPLDVVELRLQQAVNTTLRSVMNQREIENIDTLVDLHEINFVNQGAEMETPDNLSLEQQVLEDFTDELFDGKEDVSGSVKKVVEGAFENDLAKYIEPVAVNLNGVNRQITSGYNVVFEADAEKAKELQAKVDANGEDAIFVSLSTDLNGNGVADVIEIRDGYFSFEKHPVSVNDALFFGADLNNIGRYKNLSDILPTKPEITNLSEESVNDIGEQAMLWLGSDQVGEEYEVFVVEPGAKMRQHFVGGGVIGENYRSAFTLDFRDPKVGLRKSSEYYVVVQDKNRDASIYKVHLITDAASIKDLKLSGSEELDSSMKFDDSSEENSAETLLAILSRAVVYEGSAKNLVDVGKSDAQFLTGVAIPGSRVSVTWKSIVRSSVVLTDAKGNFEVQVPKELEKGRHEGVAFAYNKKKGIITNIKSVIFNR